MRPQGGMRLAGKPLSRPEGCGTQTGMENDEKTRQASAKHCGRSAGDRAGRRRRRRKKRNKPEGPAPLAAAAPATPAVTDGWCLEDFQVPEREGKVRFHDLGLPLALMRAVHDCGFAYCTPIQAEILPATLAGRDAVGQAQTGTGKTAAFLLTILARFTNADREEKRDTGEPRALILAPTRELVVQIGRDAEALARYLPIRVMAVYGGIDYQKQLAAVERQRIDLLVATPGRLLDFMRRQAVRLGRVEVLVIDEADRMLDMGFIPDVRRIVYGTPPKERRQTLFFSATITPEVERLAAQWTRDPVRVAIEPEQVAVDTVEQIAYVANGEEKYAILYNLIVKRDLRRVMVFANRRDETRRLAERLRAHDIDCALLSGDVPQKKRMRILDDFRRGKIRVLVTTDVAGRGIHIDGVSHVINYTLPYEPEDYVHRIGRTGRAGALGTAISFACEEGGFYLPDIEEFIGRKLPCADPPEELLEEPPPAAPPAPEDRGRPPRARRSRRRRR